MSTKPISYWDPESRTEVDGYAVVAVIDQQLVWVGSRETIEKAVDLLKDIPKVCSGKISAGFVVRYEHFMFF